MEIASEARKPTELIVGELGNGKTYMGNGSICTPGHSLAERLGGSALPAEAPKDRSEAPE